MESFKEIVQTSGMTRDEVAVLLGKSRSLVDSLCAGRRNASADQIALIKAGAVSPSVEPVAIKRAAGPVHVTPSSVPTVLHTLQEPTVTTTTWVKPKHHPRCDCLMCKPNRDAKK